MHEIRERRELRRLLLRPLSGVLLATLLVVSSGCSLRKAAVRTLADALVSSDGGANVFASDDDAELVGDALPFAIKTLEMLLQQDPENADLLFTLCSTYTQYSYAFVELESEKLRYDDHRRSRQIRERAVNLYLRGRDYCFGALEQSFPGIRKRLLSDTEQALANFDVEYVPLLYWTAGSWGSAISSGRHRSELLIDLEVVRAVLERALELDEDYDRGALHDAMVAIEALPEAMGGSYEQARFHYQRAVELNGGRRVGSHLAWAWLVTIGEQDRDDFEATLEKAVAVKDEAPGDRLANRVNRDFARFLLDQVDDLFLEDLEDEDFTDEQAGDEP